MIGGSGGRELPGGAGRLPRIAWVTNVSAPYRRPVWAALARQAELKVGLLADNEPNRQWTSELPEGVGRLKTRAAAVHRGDLHLYLLLAPVLRRDVDVVVLPGWESPAAWQLLLEAKLRRIRTVAFYESGAGSHRFSDGPIATARRLFFRSVDAVVTVGAESEETVLSFGVRRDRVVATYNTVDVATIHNVSRREGLKSTAVDRTHSFVYVGQLIHRKNVDGLLEAFADLPESAHLVVAGEGPEDAALRHQAKRLGIVGRVDFRGYVPYEQVPQVLAEASTLVLPSRSEVYGLVVMEALAAGLHVVVANSCGVLSDVRELFGVYPAQASQGSLAGAMRLSAEAWTGPLEQPAILARTPEATARDVLRACKAFLG